MSKINHMDKTDSLIHTKLHQPFIRSLLVHRLQLQEQVSQGLRGPLTLITAPAGFGKTTLVATCVANCGFPVAWLSLDRNDNLVGRFLSYVIAALQNADNRVGLEAAQLMVGMQQMLPELVLTSLINDLDSTNTDIVLVLDDYQFINNQIVHEEVTFLLDHCPKTFHLLIATRSDPPLPLSRFRAHGQMVELRTADLRFTQAETIQFLNDVMDIHLDAGSIEILAERTEGWIVGLQMAALSIRSRKDVSGFIVGISGTNRYILDYLLEEVLATQQPEIQFFLLCTSILERFCAPLCDAILVTRELRTEGNNNSRPSPFEPRTILDYLERVNLFLVPLDDDRIWFRYHHLFADLLRTRLNQLYPELVIQLHARAANWLEHEGMTVEAVNQALAAGKYDQAARLVEENTTRLIALGELNALISWIETLPTEQRKTRPWLCVQQADAMMFAGRPAEVGPLLAQAEAAIIAGPVQISSSSTGPKNHTYNLLMSDAENRALQGAIAAVRAFTSVTMGKDSEGFSQAQQARELLLAEDLFHQSLVSWVSGKTMLGQGHLPEAHLAFKEQIRLGRAMGNTWTILAGQTYLAQILQAEGELYQARALLTDALADASKQGARSRGYIAWVEDGLVSLLYEQNELEEAKYLLTEAVALLKQWPNPNHLIYTYSLQTRVLVALGDYQGARKAIIEADMIRRNTPLTRWLRRVEEADLVRMWLVFQKTGVSFAPGDPLAEQSNAVLSSWRSEIAASLLNDNITMDECEEIASLTLARISLAEGKSDDALALLEPVTRRVKAAGHLGATIGALVLTAIAWQGKPGKHPQIGGQPDSAFIPLEEALCLAVTRGYIRVFLDMGQPMQLLLAQWISHANPGSTRDYAIRLLNLFSAEPFTKTTDHKKTSQANDLVEPLSQRELEVLHLMSLGRTNQEIAQHLVVAPGTIKAHAASIYRKLDVANRTEAVARSREMGILQ